MAVRELDLVRGVMQDLAARGQAEQAEALGKVLAVAAAALGERSGHQREYLTTGQAADILGVSRQTIVNWVGGGQLPGVRLGGRTLLHRDAVLGEVDRLKEARPVARADADAGVRASRSLVGTLPAEQIARLEDLHMRMEAGERLSRSERTEMVALERALADAAARELRQRVRAARSRSR
ncbi:MAG TPA: helix-turn-helix domain-containing protein [Chloroflexota bacterium]|nr:helix-turn-helix domain-containing protein [Chloroflexota bacterium]